jgi:uncharacterized protein (TIGR03437 family)
MKAFLLFATALFTLAAPHREVWAQELVYTKLPAGDTAPAPRLDAPPVYDPVGREIYVFGGGGDISLNDLWAYSLIGKRWREVRATSGAPPARFGHTAVYDSARRRIVVFGGQAMGFFNDVWAFDIAARGWAQLSTGGPNKRYGHSAVYDAARDRMIISHGFTDDGRFDDTWAFEFATNTWRNLNPQGEKPVRRCLHHAVLDTQANQMLLFGGCASGAGPCPLNDLWALDLASHRWIQRFPNQPNPGRPVARQWYGSAFDEFRRRMVVFGGSGGGNLNDTWEYAGDSNTWDRTRISGELPEARQRHEGTWIGDLRAIAFFGGRAGFQLTNELWLLAAPGAAPPNPAPNPDTRPRIALEGVVNAFSNEYAAFAPGEIISLYGERLGPAEPMTAQFDGNGSLPTQLANVRVRAGGIAAPLFYVSEGQINFQIPYELASMRAASIEVERDGQLSNTVSVELTATHPGLWPGALHADGTLVTAESPARAGEILIFFATGQGVTNPPSVSGTAATAPYPEPVASVRLSVGLIPAQIQFRGQAPGTAGVMQINAAVPAGVPAGEVQVVLDIGLVRVQNPVRIYVARE